jgi:sigma-B regulation protein RsbU (phosphoserine phosphatase)
VAFLATPLFKHPHLVGVAAFQLSTDEVYQVVNDYTGLGRTGETVIAARYGNEAVIITPTQHDPQAAFHRAVRIGSALGRPLQEAVQARKGAGLAMDDRGRETLAIWKYVPYLRWGMVVQIDAAEAFAPVARLRTAAAVIAVATLLLAALAAVCVARAFANPIVQLTAMTKVLAGGDLSRTVEVPSGNEIGELAASFNDMASQLAASIERLQETTAAKERIESEIQVAHDIQMSMVPRSFPAFPGRSEVDIYARLVPAREMGGDLYDFFFLDEDHLCFVIGDVSGKGVPASLFMAVTQTLLRATASTNRGPDEILSLLNRGLCRDNETCMFVSLFCGILDIYTGAVHHSSGGHNPPYVCTLEGNRTVSGAQGAVLGAVDEAVYQAQEVMLAPGDVFFLYTDGVTEAMDGADHLFTEARLEACLCRVGCLPSAALTQAVLDEVYAFVRGAPQSDDLTMLALRYLGPRNTPEGKHTVSMAFH